MDKSTTNQNDSQWPAVLEALKGSMPVSPFNTHFLGSVATVDGQRLIVTVPPSANLEMIENRLSGIVKQRAKSVYGAELELEFVRATTKRIGPDEITDNKKPIGIKDQRKRPGFFMVENDLFNKGHAARMRPNAMAAYFCLLMHAGQDEECFPSYATIAKEIGVTRPTAIKGVKTLASLCYIEVQHQYNNKGEFTSNLFIILDSSIISFV